MLDHITRRTSGVVTDDRVLIYLLVDFILITSEKAINFEILLVSSFNPTLIISLEVVSGLVIAKEANEMVEDLLLVLAIVMVEIKVRSVMVKLSVNYFLLVRGNWPHPNSVVFIIIIISDNLSLLDIVPSKEDCLHISSIIKAKISPKLTTVSFRDVKVIVDIYDDF